MRIVKICFFRLETAVGISGASLGKCDMHRRRINVVQWMCRLYRCSVHDFDLRLFIWRVSGEFRNIYPSELFVQDEEIGR